MSDRLIWTLVAAAASSAAAASAILCCSAAASASAILCCSAAAAVALTRSAGAFLISSLIVSLLARSRAVRPSYTCMSDSEQRNRRNQE